MIGVSNFVAANEVPPLNSNTVIILFFTNSRDFVDSTEFI